MTSLFGWRALGLLAGVLCAAPTPAANPATQAGEFRLDAPIERVLPVFTARGESAWAPGWAPRFLSGDTARGSVFQAQDPGRPTTTWIVTDYRPNDGIVQYARIAESSNIGLVDIECLALPGRKTRVRVRYTLTPLSPDGATFISQFLNQESFSHMLEQWRNLIELHLRKASAVIP